MIIIFTKYMSSSYTCTSCSEASRTSIHWASATGTSSPKTYSSTLRQEFSNCATSAQPSTSSAGSLTCPTFARAITAHLNLYLAPSIILPRLVSATIYYIYNHFVCYFWFAIKMLYSCFPKYIVGCSGITSDWLLIETKFYN